MSAVSAYDRFWHIPEVLQSGLWQAIHGRVYEFTP